MELSTRATVCAKKRDNGVSLSCLCTNKAVYSLLRLLQGVKTLLAIVAFLHALFLAHVTSELKKPARCGLVWGWKGAF